MPLDVLSNNYPLPLLSRDALRSKASQLPEEFWRNRLLAQGYRVIIAGAPKVGKSDFFLEMAVRAASAGCLLGESFKRPLKVLYLQTEIQDGYLNERLSTFEKNCSVSEQECIDKNFITTQRCSLNIMQQKDWDKLHRTLELMKPDIVAFDPIISFSDIDENSSQEVAALLYSQLGQLQVSIKPSPCIILIHHLKKTTTRQDKNLLFTGIRGSSAWQGWYDTAILLTRSNEGIHVYYETRNQYSPEAQLIVLNRSLGCWQVQSITPKTANEKIDFAFNVVRQSQSPIAITVLRDQLMESLGVARRTAYNIIDGLRKDSRIIIVTKGKQSIHLGISQE